MTKRIFGNELEDFKKYLRSNSNEDAKRPLIFPLFKKLYGSNFVSESDARGADGYVPGQLIIESKTDFNQWCAGFYQALHYRKIYGLAYTTIMVVTKEFVGIWKLNKIPEKAAELANTSDPDISPNQIGKKNSKKSSKSLKLKIKDSAFYWLEPNDLKGDIFGGARNLTTESYEILKILKNLDSNRLQINTHNFIHVIERMKSYFEEPIDAIHAFYSIVNYWDITSTVASDEHTNDIRVIGFNGHKFSEAIEIPPKYKKEFIKFVENQYVFTNEGSGLTADYYFSRFDEVINSLDPDYAKQHGIFFTNDNLSKFANWFVHKYFKADFGDNYIVFDPAGGSGNLVTSWRGNIKHKIVSELQPDLLKTIEKRMKIDPYHIDKGFTIIPKTSDNIGLNFLDISAKEYLNQLEKELERKHLKMNKPFAFLLNPPYKNTDEDKDKRESKDAEYQIHESIYELTGNDAGKERYLAFLGQILLMCEEQKKLNLSFEPLVFIFTPTSWLIPRPTYINFRMEWDNHFKYENGFIVTSNEFFKLKGKWPLAFTIWSYNGLKNINNVNLHDFTNLNKIDLNFNWNLEKTNTEKALSNIVEKSKKVRFDGSKSDIRNFLPKISKNQKNIIQPRYNFYRNKRKDEEGLEIISGFPRNDNRHARIKAPHGFVDGSFVGFMDDNTPVRIKNDTCNRLSNNPDRLWFRLDNVFININQTKAFNGPPDNRGYCAYDLESAKITFAWFAITKSLNGQYPIWANQFNIWMPNITKEKEDYFYSLCYAFTLAENRCIVMKFEANNPVLDSPEIFVDNPMSVNNPDSFWNTTLDNEIIKAPVTAIVLVNKIKELYRLWNLEYCKGDILESVGLHDETYFKYFNSSDFLTKNSGLIQIKKYAQIEGANDLLIIFDEISSITKNVKQEIFDLLNNDFNYFD